MEIKLPFVLTVCISAVCVLGESTVGDDQSPYLRGAEIMSECLARIPNEKFAAEGRLTLRRKYGIEIKELDFSAEFNWSEQPCAESVYEFHDLNGKLVERVFFRQGEGLTRTFGIGDIHPDPEDSVQGSDVTWLDATLSYVRWDNPKFAGTERVKGFECDIVDVFPPFGGACSRVRLWITQSDKVVMRARQYFADGETRTMWVRSVQKIGGRWVPGDLEVETAGSGHRTRLRFDSVISEEQTLRSGV